MHETSLVQALIGQVDELVASSGGGLVRCVRLEIGPLSGVEPAFVASAWEQLRTGAGLGETTLMIDEVPLVALCRACKKDFQPVRFCFHCPECGGIENDTVSGEGVILHSIELDDVREGAGA
jgi:hydrogenase nickel incorporation protein HypA/HybF